MLFLAAALLPGCPGGSSSVPAPDADTRDHGFVDGPGPVDGSLDLAPQADGASLDAPATCPFGNLLATIPALPPLCRAFAAPAPGPPPQDPPQCQTGPKVNLTAADDNYVGSDTVKDDVSGLDGGDVIKGLGCSDRLAGNAGADELHGNEGADELRGGAGSDKIFAGAGHDSIWGGGGADTINGGGGDDKYYYAEGDGDDVITEYSGYDTIVCAPNFGQPKARITAWSRVGDNLVLTMAASGSVTVTGYFTSADSSIDDVVGCD
jgi:hypothetical protein